MIEKLDFAKLIAFLEAGCGCKAATEMQNEVYFDLLRDLPLAALQAAAKRALLAHRYPTLPPVGMLREYAMELIDGQAPTHGEAFDLVMTAVRRFGYMQETAGLESLDLLCRRAVRAMGGWQAMCEAPIDERSTTRAQFRMAYDALSDRDQDQRNLPESIRPTSRIGADARRIVNQTAGNFGRIE